MKTDLFLLIGVVGMLLACQHKPADEHGISQSVYMDKLDRSLEARIFQSDETLMHPDSLPADWEEQVQMSRYPNSWFYEYFCKNDTVISEDEMAEIFKTVFENDFVLNMEVPGLFPLSDMLKFHDIAFFNNSEIIRAPLMLKDGIVLNFNNHPTSMQGLNLRMYRLPNSILWIEFNVHYPIEYRERFDSKIIVGIQVKWDNIIPLFARYIES